MKCLHAAMAVRGFRGGCLVAHAQTNTLCSPVVGASSINGHGLRVFVSCTVLDGRDRQKVIEDAILSVGMVPVGLERLTASTKPTVEERQEQVRGCDWFVGILAHRYGEIPQGSSRSLLEMEYDTAKAEGMPRLMFMLDPSTKVDPNADFDRGSDRWEKQQKLDAFKVRVTKEQMPAHFREETLGIRVVTALGAERERRNEHQNMPSRPNSATDPTADRLEAAYRRREVLLLSCEDTAEVDAEILVLRRLQRCGPTLATNEFLGDGRFRLIEVVGRGGFATVWKAYDRYSHGFVAVKVLHGQFAEVINRRERLFRGARRMSEIQHPNIVRVLLSEGEDQGFYYYVMEYVEGGDLHHAITTRSFGIERSIAIVEEIAGALEAAHARGLVHRDVKPRNILLRKDGTSALTDFDLVHAHDTTGGTRTGALGTVHYAAPEQNEDASTVDHRADIYSLGMTAVFCIHGKKFPQAVMYQRERFLAGLQCPSPLRNVLQHAVAIQPEDRFETMTAFRSALADVRRRLLLGDVDVADTRASKDRIESIRSEVQRLQFELDTNGELHLHGESDGHHRLDDRAAAVGTRMDRLSSSRSETVDGVVVPVSAAPEMTQRRGTASRPSTSVENEVVGPGLDGRASATVSRLGRRRMLVGTPVALGGIALGVWALGRDGENGKDRKSNPYDGLYAFTDSGEVDEAHAENEAVNEAGNATPGRSLEHTLRDARDVESRPMASVDLVRVPGGRFLMGSPPDEDGRNVYSHVFLQEIAAVHPESPQHEVSITGFRLASTPVTNAQYRLFIKDTNYRQPEFWSDPSSLW